MTTDRIHIYPSDKMKVKSLAVIKNMKMADMVAEIINYYIEEMNKLSDDDFDGLMKQHDEMHSDDNNRSTINYK